MAIYDVLGNEVSVNKLKDNLDKIDELYEKVDDIVEEIVHPICGDLDNYMKSIDNDLVKGDLGNEDLQELVMNLPSLLYMISSKREKLHLKENISKAVYKNVYSKARNEIKGTVADKDAYAITEATMEALSVIIYDHVVDIIKTKEENAQEMLNSAKKVLTFRLGELGISSYTDGR